MVRGYITIVNSNHNTAHNLRRVANCYRLQVLAKSSQERLNSENLRERVRERHIGVYVGGKKRNKDLGWLLLNAVGGVQVAGVDEAPPSSKQACVVHGAFRTTSTSLQLIKFIFSHTGSFFNKSQLHN